MKRLHMHSVCDDRGIAMVTAMLVLMVVAILSVAAISLSSHELSSSANDRQRVTSINGAEAGLDRFFQYVETTPSSSIACNNPYATPQALSTSPAASYTVNVTYYDSSLNPLSCSGAVPGNAASMVVKSVGSEGSDKRTMEAYVRLTPVSGGSFGPYAIFAGTTVTISGAANTVGDPSGTYNADVYSGDALTLSGGGTIQGNVFSRKTVVLSGGTQVMKDVVAKQALTMSGGSIVWGNGTSSTDKVSLSGGSTTIKGNATACTTIGASGGASITGTQAANVCPNPATPIAQPFPTYTFDASKWTGYSVQTFAGSGNTPCTNALNWINNNLVAPHATTGNYALRITGSTCQLSLSGGMIIKQRGDFAIVSDGSLAVSGGSTFQSGDGQPHKLNLIFGYGQPTSCTNAGTINLSGQTTIDPQLTTLLYTPCTISTSGGSLVASGQMYAGNWDNNSGGASITFVPTGPPDNGSGYFLQDIAYIREVTS